MTALKAYNGNLGINKLVNVPNHLSILKAKAQDLYGVKLNTVSVSDVVSISVVKNTKLNKLYTK